MKQLFILSLLLVMVTSCRFNKTEELISVDTNELDSISKQVETTEKIEGDTKADNSEDVKNIDAKKEDLVNSKNKGIDKNQTVEIDITTQKTIKESEAVEDVIEKKVEVNDVDHSQWNALLRKNVSSLGNVNYKGFLKDKILLESYLNMLSAKIPDANWSKSAKLAYWINVYNAFTIKLIVDNYPTKSIKNIANPWGEKFFELEGVSYSLEQVEHEVLTKMNEPRIHFAINCASYSCPNLANQAYISNTIDKQLTEVTKKFINDSLKNVITEKDIKISEIFNWFSKDFKTANTSVIDFLNKYSETKISEDAKVHYLDYNWSLNE